MSELHAFNCTKKSVVTDFCAAGCSLDRGVERIGLATGKRQLFWTKILEQGAAATGGPVMMGEGGGEGSAMYE